MMLCYDVYMSIDEDIEEYKASVANEIRLMVLHCLNQVDPGMPTEMSCAVADKIARQMEVRLGFYVTAKSRNGLIHSDAIWSELLAALSCIQQAFIWSPNGVSAPSIQRQPGDRPWWPSSRD